MHIYSNPDRASNEYALPDVEVFYWDAADAADFNDYSLIANPDSQYVAGWYYWACFPGCMPDSDPIGPFNSEAEAISNAQEDL